MTQTDHMAILAALAFAAATINPSPHITTEQVIMLALWCVLIVTKSFQEN